MLQRLVGHMQLIVSLMYTKRVVTSSDMAMIDGHRAGGLFQASTAKTVYHGRDPLLEDAIL